MGIETALFSDSVDFDRSAASSGSHDQLVLSSILPEPSSTCEP
jgi:hypothetical protein